MEIASTSTFVCIISERPILVQTAARLAAFAELREYG
jgi:hypothetical protein